MRPLFYLWDRIKLSRQLARKKRACNEYYQFLRWLEQEKIEVGDTVGAVKDPQFLQKKKELRKLRLWLELQTQLDRYPSPSDAGDS